MLKTWFSFKLLNFVNGVEVEATYPKMVEVILKSELIDRWNTLIKGWEGEIVSIGIKAIKDDITDFSKTVEIFVLEEKIELAKEELKLLKGL